MTERNANIERIIDWIEGRLSPAEADSVAAEVAADPATGELAGLYRSARTTLAGDRSEAPSDALMQRLRAIGTGATAAAGPVRGVAPVLGRLASLLEDLAAVPRAVADLVHDSRHAQPGLRGAAAADAPAFLAAWSDGTFVVELQLERRGADWSVIGQVSREDGADAAALDEVAIRCRRLDGDESDADADVTVAVDEGGVFETTLATGTWAIAAVLPDRVVLIEQLSLGTETDTDTDTDTDGGPPLG